MGSETERSTIRARAETAARMVGEKPDSDAFLAFANGYEQALESLRSDVRVMRDNVASQRVRGPSRSIVPERAGALDALDQVIRLIETGDVV